MRKPEFRWGTEPPPERPWGAWLLAAAVHSLFLFGWITGRPIDAVRFPVRFIALAPLESAGRETPIPIPADGEERSRGVRSPRSTLITPPPPRPPRPLPLAERPESVASAPAGPHAIPRLGPGIAQGHLWVQPLPMSPKLLAAAVTHRDAKEIADSFVTAIVQAYLDSIAHDPDVVQVSPPSWVADVGGKKFGIDASSIYIAGLRIPTAVLALLPIPTGNQRPIDHALEGIAYDLRVAGARSANLDEFRQRVRALRQQKEADRQYERNRETPPSDTLTGHVEH